MITGMKVLSSAYLSYCNDILPITLLNMATVTVTQLDEC